MVARTFKTLRCSIAMVAACMFLAEPGWASVVVDGTRVVYASGKREVSLSMRNVGDLPSLVQVWIDAGDASLRPADMGAPFVLTPPLFRLDPAKGQTLRLIYTQQPLPEDRESVFWLNVLDIPPRIPSEPTSSNRLEMAFRHRLKVFFRPASLRGDAGEAANSVTWTVERRSGAVVLEARNPTPFYISFAEVSVSSEGGTFGATTDMLPPFATREFPLSKRNESLSGPITVKYGFVNDYGAIVTGEAVAGDRP